MNCEGAKDRLLDYLNNELPAADRATLDAHLANCPDCRHELAETKQVWQLMATVPTPEPRPDMRTNFYAMLDTFAEAEAARPTRSWTSILDQIKSFWTPTLAARLAYSLLLVSLGVAAGYWLQQKQSPDVAYRQQIDTLSSQVQEMRQMMMLSMLENPSATERLRAVSYTKDISDVDGRVIDALLTTLNNDPNVNVRLVTLEALADLGHDSRVREGLIHALPQQDSPLVQVALADVMVKLQEKRSLKPLRQMLRQEGLNDLVKSKIEQTIRELS
ncbi:HEAT repeat domain-containing protein [Fibrisoma montanum]|uniref:HEAT repeat domain-containing protein n=1 Tax=Fibrisoma montanum TaxID=2305895 RepID=A0A418LVK5_9BACT|nr:zf-HC2 domain-containing protein [Fibrisoma montanum]RIV17260.1 HEAT repeat domain-containing protein [Fibrisoma montanum]